MVSATAHVGPPHAAPHRTDATAWALLAGSVVVHVALACVSGSGPEDHWFGTCMQAAGEHGVPQVSQHVWWNGPPGYLYVLKAVGTLWTMLTGGPLPPDDSLRVRLLLRLAPTLADLGAAWCLFRIASDAGPRTQALLVLAAYAYNPAVLLNSAVWGRPESVTSLLLVLAASLVWRGRPALGGGIFAGACMTQLHAIAVLPALALGVALRARLPGSFAALRGAGIALLLLLFPFYWVQRGPAVVESLLSPASRYAFLSFGAQNLWWLVGSGPASRWTSDAEHIGSALLTYRAVGRILLVTVTVLVLWRLWRDLQPNPRETPRALCEACALQLLALYLLPTGTYAHGIVPVLVFAAAVCVWRRTAWVLYAAVSAGAFVSLLGARFGTGQPEATAVSVLFIGVFVLGLLWTSDRQFAALGSAAALVVAAAVGGVAALPLPRKQHLSDWQPVGWWQDRYEPHSNRSVQGGRLSVGGMIFRHGIGTQTNSQITYDLNGAFTTFDTLYALDDSSTGAPKVQFRILVDGQPRFDSGTVGPGVPPRHARVSVAGAQVLTLEVVDGGDGIEGDHADWLEPVLER